ncbi:NVEALA domain-containing protein [Viscerimonas tarda]
MKKKIFGSLAILAIAAVTVLNVNLSSQKELLSDISLANVEALAQDEDNRPTGTAATLEETTYTYNEAGQLINVKTITRPCCAQDYPWFYCDVPPC